MCKDLDLGWVFFLLDCFTLMILCSLYLIYNHMYSSHILVFKSNEMIYEFQGIVSHYFVTVCFKIVALQQHNLVYKKNYLKLESLIPIGQFTKGRIGFCSSSTVDINNSNGRDLIRIFSSSLFSLLSVSHKSFCSRSMKKEQL